VLLELAFHLSWMSLISQAFAPDSIFGMDRMKKFLLIAEQGENFATQVLVICARAIYEGRSALGIELQSRFKDGPNFLPFFPVHAGVSPRLISLGSQAAGR
jgi:hypothetical protein